MKLPWILAVVFAMSVPALGQTATAQDTPPASVGQPSSPPPGVYRVGGDVKPPVPISMPDPHFSREARKKMLSGDVLVRLIVDVNGNPQQVHVIRSLTDKVDKKDFEAALSLDASAVEAVMGYRFHPAMKEGHPVPVEMNVDVHFQISCCQGKNLHDDQNDPELRTAYEHFFGTWTGIWSGNMPGHLGEKAPITLVISETKQRDALQIDYTYSKKGMKDYSHVVRYMLIEPRTSTVRMKWKHNSEELYKAERLDEFLKAGYGTFTFSGVDRGDPHQELRCTMTLTQDTFEYRWEEHVDGGPYKLRATWEMKRERSQVPPVAP